MLKKPLSVICSSWRYLVIHWRFHYLSRVNPMISQTYCSLFLSGPSWQVFHCVPETKAPCRLRWRNLKTEISLWKHIKCFPSTLRRRNLKTQQLPVILAGKAPFSKCFPSIIKREADGLEFLWFEERFWKGSSSCRISVDGRQNRRIKAAYCGHCLISFSYFRPALTARPMESWQKKWWMKE